MKYNYYISTESTCDTCPEMTNFEMFKIIPMSYSFGDKIYYHGTKDDLTIPEFYGAMSRGDMPTTSALAPYYFEQTWEAMLKEGFDILHVAFSSGMSATYANACVVASDLMAKYPERKITVIDSLNGSTGEGLLVYHILQMRDRGDSIETITATVAKRLLHYRAMFTVDNLYHLVKSGRLSKVAAIIGSVAVIKPLLQLGKSGTIVQSDKVIGRKSSLNWLGKKIVEMIDLSFGDTIVVSDGNCIQDGDYIASIVKTHLPDLKIFRSTVGPLVGSHAGDKCLGVFFCSKEPRK